MHMPILYTEFPSRNNLPRLQAEMIVQKGSPGAINQIRITLSFRRVVQESYSCLLLPAAAAGIGTDVTAKWSKKLERKLNRTGEDNFSFH